MVQIGEIATLNGGHQKLSVSSLSLHAIGDIGISGCYSQDQQLSVSSLSSHAIEGLEIRVCPSQAQGLIISA